MNTIKNQKIRENLCESVSYSSCRFEGLVLHKVKGGASLDGYKDIIRTYVRIVK